MGGGSERHVDCLFCTPIYLVCVRVLGSESMPGRGRGWFSSDGAASAPVCIRTRHCQERKTHADAVLCVTLASVSVLRIPPLYLPKLNFHYASAPTCG